MAPSLHDTAFFDTLCGIRLRRLQGLFATHWQRRFRAQDLAVTPVQGGLMIAIRDNPGISQVALARLMRIEAPTLIQSLAPLLRQGLVQRMRSAADGRAFELTLTRSGRAAASLVATGTPAHEADLLRHLDDDERVLLRHLLDKAIAGGEEALLDLQHEALPA